MILLVASLPLLPIVSGQATPGPPPTVVPDIFVDMSPSGSGIGSTSFEVVNDGTESVRIRVTGQIPGFRSDLENRIYTIGGNSAVAISFTILSNSSTHLHAIKGMVFIEVTHVNGKPIDGVSEEGPGFTVWTQQYSVPVIQFPSGIQRIGPGEIREIPIEVANAGNIRDYFLVEIIDVGMLSSDTIEIGLMNTTTHQLDPGETQTIGLRVATSGKAGIYDEYYAVKVLVHKGNRTGSMTATIVLHVRGLSTPWNDLGAMIVLFILMVVGVRRSIVHRKQRKPWRGGKQ